MIILSIGEVDNFSLMFLWFAPKELTFCPNGDPFLSDYEKLPKYFTRTHVKGQI